MDSSQKAHDVDHVDSALSPDAPNVSTVSESDLQEDIHSEHSWELVVSESGRCQGDSPLDDEAAPSSPPLSPASSQRGSDAEQLLEMEAYAFTSAEDGHSDAETYTTDDLLRRGEPEPYSSTAPAARWGDKPWPSTQASASISEQQQDDEGEHATTTKEGIAQFAAGSAGTSDTNEDNDGAGRTAAEAAGLMNAPRRFVFSLADRLRMFAARVCAYVARRRQPQDVAEDVVLWLKTTAVALARSLRIRVAAGSVAAADLASAVADHARQSTLPKTISSHLPKRINWQKVALVLGCSTLAVQLYRSNAANARLAARLAQREGELAELVARIVALQRSVTSSPVAILRRTTTTRSYGTSSIAAGWPSMLQAI